VFDDVTSGKLTDRQYKTRTVKETLEGAGLLSYPYILAISSIKSSLIEISLRREGTYTVKVSAYFRTIRI
jgi:hypothetical protein